MAADSKAIEVIRALSAALMNFQHTVNAADLRVSLTAGANIMQANEQANNAISLYSEWSLSILRN